MPAYAENAPDTEPRLSFRIPSALMSKIDHEAGVRGYSRSEMVRYALESWFEFINDGSKA